MRRVLLAALAAALPAAAAAVDQTVTTIPIPVPPAAEDVPDVRGDEVVRRALRLRAEHAPEAVLVADNAHNQIEDIWRTSLAGRWDLNEDYTWVNSGAYDHFKLKDGPSTNLTEVETTLLRRIGNGRGWAAAEAFSTGGIGAAGLSAGGNGTAAGGIDWRVAGAFDRPWDASTQAVVNHGRVDELGGGLAMPFGKWLVASVDVMAAHYAIGPGIFQGSGSAGDSLDAGARIDWTVWRRPDAVIGSSFVERTGRDQDPLVAHIAVYGAVRRHFHNDPSPLVPVITNSFDYRVGGQWGQPLALRCGTLIDAYLGGDPLRDRNFGKNYGVNARFVYVPGDALRLWIGGAYDAELTNGVGGGKTTTIEGGVDCHF